MNCEQTLLVRTWTGFGPRQQTSWQCRHSSAMPPCQGCNVHLVFWRPMLMFSLFLTLQCPKFDREIMFLEHLSKVSSDGAVTTFCPLTTRVDASMSLGEKPQQVRAPTSGCCITKNTSLENKRVWFSSQLNQEKNWQNKEGSWTTIFCTCYSSLYQIVFNCSCESGRILLLTHLAKTQKITPQQLFHWCSS